MIAVEQRELLLQRDFLRPLIAQRGPEHLAQSAEHVDHRLLLSLTRQRGDVVQRGEEKVGIDSLASSPSSRASARLACSCDAVISRRRASR